ncbi:unnamed protein product [Oikopleura dioica]|uniref:Protein kinase domain-containing protein n=1 Tax=Oikopleura dioica TaxID=34765 RepID=E4WQN0_OIKDI|nr:unnamed protein product [Oikopleura dioica]
MRRDRIPAQIVTLPDDPTRPPPGNPSCYRKVGKIGDGSYGNVTKAVNINNGEYYAIKTHKNMNSYSGDQIRYRLMNEITFLSSDHLLGNLNSPYVVELLDWFQSKDKNYSMVMDFHQMDLHKLMVSQDLTRSQIKLILAELVLAIEACHARGVLHNDIKPENVLVTSDGHMVLTDFGIAELLLPGEKTFGRYGTPLYMSPESLQIKGHDFQADWWSLGVMAFELLAGYVPYEGRTSSDLVREQKKKLLYPENMDRISKDFIQSLLKRNPANRLSSDLELLKSHPFFDGIDWEALALGEVRSNFNKFCCDSETNIEQRKRKEPVHMFAKMKRFFSAKKMFTNSVPQSPIIRKCRSRFSLRSIMTRSTGARSTPCQN